MIMGTLLNASSLTCIDIDHPNFTKIEYLFFVDYYDDNNESAGGTYQSIQSVLW